MFSDEFDEMMRVGGALVVGSVLADGTPRATRAWSYELVDPAARRIRFTMSADDPAIVADLTSGRVALTGANVVDFRSVQVKGPVVAVDELRESDAELMQQQAEQLFAAIEATDGNPAALMRRILPLRAVAVEVQVEEEFDQTPGPGAGAALRSRERGS